MAGNPIGLLYEAAVKSTRWSEALAAVAGECSAAFAHLFWRDHHDGMPPLSLTGGESDPQADVLYAAHYYKLDPRLPLAESMPEGRAYSCRDYIDVDYVARSELYQDFLIPFNLRYTMVGNLVTNDETSAVLAVLRSARQGSFEKATISHVECIIPHVTRAVRISRQLALARTTQNAFHVALDMVGQGAIIVDRHSRILTLNPTAEKLLCDHRGLRAVQGFLSASEPSDATALKHLIISSAEVVRGHSRGFGGVVTIRRASGQPPLVVTAVPLPERTAIHLDAGEPAILLLVTDPHNRTREMTQWLGRRFALTRAETEVAIELRKGHRIREIAARRKTSPETVRSQVKAIYAKVGVDSHIAFLAKISG